MYFTGYQDLSFWHGDETPVLPLGHISLPEEHMYSVNVSGVETDGVRRFGDNILEGQEVIWHLRRSNHFAGSLQAKHQQVKDKAIELDNE